MEKKIREYVENLFEDAPNTKKARELEEEMIQNLTDKYRDLLAEGKTEESAYKLAITGIGDVSGLIRELEAGCGAEDAKSKNRSALLTAASVMLYILSPIPIIIFRGAWGGTTAIAFMFMMVAAATGLIIYNSMTKPRYRRADDTVVEEFKEWKSEKSGKKAVRKSISSAIWSVTLALYLIISFMTMAWYITWIIFIIGAAASNIVSAVLDSKEA